MSSKSTKPRVLVDSSIWITYFRDPGAPASTHLERLMRAEEVLVAGPVVYEVLQGARSHDEFRTFRRILEGLPYLMLSSTSWVAAAGVAAGLRRRSLNLPMTGVLLATLARESRCRVWSEDAHFETIPGVHLYRPLRSCRRRRPA